MKINTLYFPKHAYTRLIERSFEQMKWDTERYPVRFYKDFLFEFFNELFSESLKIGKIRRDEYFGEVKVFDAELIVPIHVKYKEAYVPTLLVKKRKIHKDRLLEWLLPVELKPYKPRMSLNDYYDRTELYISYDSFIHDLEEYEKKKNFIKLDKSNFKDKVLVYPYAGSHRYIV